MAVSRKIKLQLLIKSKEIFIINRIFILRLITENKKFDNRSRKNLQQMKWMQTGHSITKVREAERTQPSAVTVIV